MGKGGGVPYSRRPFSNAHAGGICNAPGANNKDGLALQSGRNRFNHGFDICNPGRPFFDFSTTIYAAVIRSVQAYGNSDEQDGLTVRQRLSHPGPVQRLKTTAAQLLTDAVSTPTSIWTLFHNQVTGAASVFSYLTPTNQGTVATNPLNFATGGTELWLFPLLTLPISRPANRQVQQGQRNDTHYCAAVRAAGSAAGAFGRCKPVRPHFSTHPPTQPYEPPRRMGNATGTRGGFPAGSFPCEIASLRSSLNRSRPFFFVTQCKKHMPCTLETPIKV